MPLVEVVGKEIDPPGQIAEIWLNAGVTLYTVTVIVVGNAHGPPAFGVNVYVVVCALLMAGLHVPTIPLLEVVGSVNAVPKQTGWICVNVGAVPLFTVTVMVVVDAH